jgi:hypothetical protein
VEEEEEEEEEGEVLISACTILYLALMISACMHCIYHTVPGFNYISGCGPRCKGKTCMCEKQCVLKKKALARADFA